MNRLGYLSALHCGAGWPSADPRVSRRRRPGLAFGALLATASLSAAADDSSSAAPDTALKPVVDAAASEALASNADVTRLELMIGIGVVALLVLGLYYFSQRGMASWTLGRRIGVGFSMMLVLLAGVATLAYETLHRASEGFAAYRDDSRHSVVAGRIQANFLEMRIASKDLIIFKDQGTTKRYDERKAKVFEFIHEAQVEIQEPVRLKMLGTIAEQVAKHAELQKQLADAMRDQRTTDEREINRRMGEIGLLIDNEVEQLKLAVIGDQDRDGPVMSAMFKRTQALLIWLGVAIVALGTACAYFITLSTSKVIRGTVRSLDEATNLTAAAADQVSAASQMLAEGSSEQAASLEESSASLEEMSSMTKRNADSANQAKHLATQTRAAADAGAADMAEMNQAMDAIKASSNEISKIIKTIDEIAFQTNILALNAAVEAARAGEAGAGFAVVADEVRRLAQRAAHSARETAAKIEDSMQKSNHGVLISTKVAKSLAEIVEKARQVDVFVAEIAAASTEQSQGISQVNKAVAQMDKVTQSTAGSAEETAAAAEELNAQAASMQQAVASLRQLVGATKADAIPEQAVASAVDKPSRGGVQQSVRSEMPLPAPLKKRMQQPVLAPVATNGSDHADSFFKDV